MTRIHLIRPPAPPDLTLTTHISAPTERSRTTSAWRFLRRASESYIGRGRLWRWAWEREFESVMADRAVALGESTSTGLRGAR